jgi:transcriptional antiterminator
MKKLPKEELNRLYLHGRFHLSELAEHFACSEETIQENLDFYEIPERPGWRGSIIAKKMNWTQREFATELYRMYHEDELGVHKIAEKLGTSPTTIWLWLWRFYIPLRNRYFVDSTICSKKGKDQLMT